MMNVVIIDDSDLVRERLRLLLSDLPGVVVVGEASGAMAARALLDAVIPDLVILDIRMPDGNGIHVLREIKQPTNAPKVIMLTNFATSAHREVCKAAGADHFFDKSTELAQVLAVLQDLSAQVGGS